MIEFIKDGDLFASGCDALVNPVNTEGVMGKGLAKGFKDRWPDMFTVYQAACRAGRLNVGEVLPIRVDDAGRKVWILNLPTKDKWRASSKEEYIDKGLRDLDRTVRELGIKSLAVPALGCGNGGLDWPRVRPKLHLFGTLLPDVLVKAYEPKD